VAASAVVEGLIPAGRTGDGSIGRLRRSGGIVLGDAVIPAPLPIRKLLKGLDLSWQKTRPVHPEADPRAQERFEKTCPA